MEEAGSLNNESQKVEFQKTSLKNRLKIYPIACLVYFE